MMTILRGRRGSNPRSKKHASMGGGRARGELSLGDRIDRARSARSALFVLLLLALALALLLALALPLLPQALRDRKSVV